MSGLNSKLRFNPPERSDTEVDGVIDGVTDGVTGGVVDGVGDAEGVTDGVGVGLGVGGVGDCDTRTGVPVTYNSDHHIIGSIVNLNRVPSSTTFVIFDICGLASV